MSNVPILSIYLSIQCYSVMMTHKSTDHKMPRYVQLYIIISHLNNYITQRDCKQLFT